jgi:N-acetylmuramoyl-L-alanine amidase
VRRRSWAWLLAIVFLFVVGLVAGWQLDAKRQVKEVVEPPHRSRSPLNEKLRRIEREVEAAREGGATGFQEPEAGQAQAATGASPLAGLTIAVDPGHNGGNASHPEEINRLVPSSVDGTTKPCNTTGTETNDGSLTEAEFNFEVARDLKRKLLGLGAKVVMTRSSNDGVGPCVNERAEIANRAAAAAAISIHADGNQSPGAHGFDVIHALPQEMVDASLVEPSLALAQKVRDALEGAGVPPANYVGKNGLDARSDLAGLNLARVPAVLVELGNMRSAEEAKLMESPGYRSKLAGALASGVMRFLEEAQS